MINGWQAAATFVIELCQRKFIDLRAVLVLCKAQLKRTWVEVLINAAWIEPPLTNGTIEIEVELLFAKVVGVIIQRAVEEFCLVRA